MIELLMSPVRVKSDTIKIPTSAIGELYQVRSGAMASDKNIIRIPETVRSERILPLIFAIIFSSHSYLVSSRTVIV